MTKSIADSYTRQSTIDFRALSNAQAGDWVTLTEHQHLVWARFTSELGGHCFDPVFQTSNTSFTYTSASNSRDLSEVNCAGTAERKIDVSGTASVRVGMAIFATSNMEVQLTLDNAATSTQLAQITATHSNSGTAWAAATTDEAYADVTDGSGVAELLTCDLQARSTDGNSADLYQIRVGEIEITSASEIPSSTTL